MNRIDPATGTVSMAALAAVGIVYCHLAIEEEFLNDVYEDLEEEMGVSDDHFSVSSMKERRERVDPCIKIIGDLQEKFEEQRLKDKLSYINASGCKLAYNHSRDTMLMYNGYKMMGSD